MKQTFKKKSPIVKNEDVWEIYPIKSNHNVVRLPIFSEDSDNRDSITFNKKKLTFSIDEFKTTGLIGGICRLNLDGEFYTINMTYPQLVEILFG